MRNFWRIVSPLRGWHPKTDGGVDYFPFPSARPLSIVRKFWVEKRETRGGGGLLPRCIILWRKPCAICTESFDQCRDSPYVSCVSCLRSSLTCPSYKLTREWLHARRAQVKNCFLLARSPHNLSSYKRHNPFGTRKKIRRLIIYIYLFITLIWEESAGHLIDKCTNTLDGNDSDL